MGSSSIEARTRTLAVSFPPELTTEYVLARVDGVEGADGQYLAWCPAHPDFDSRMKGLSVTAKPGGRALVYCHSGCSFAEIVEALREVEPHEVRIEKPSSDASLDGFRVVRRHWHLGLDMRLHGVKLRYENPETGKRTFRQLVRIPDEPMPLYHAHEVKDATEVWLSESHSDADALRAAGVFATTNLGGASEWNADYAAQLEGKDVIVVRHRDRAGHRFAQIVASSISSVRVVDPTGGNDARDHLEAGRSLDEFEEVHDA